jgi:tRNA(Ile)-lysidine synthetase-like protein
VKSVVDLSNTVKEFIGNGVGPFLLGYSGGPDSKALLYALLEAGVKPQVAHVDHGWREESRVEALALQKEVEGLGLVFHGIRLGRVPTQNLEEAAREARFAFFRSLMPFEALLLAHQADDLAETALKRVFEGAHLAFLGGMAPKIVLDGVPVWRPLLEVRKKEILQFLDERGLVPLYDRTNDDPRFLRARMRKTLIPELGAAFGKEVVPNLAVLSSRAYELKEYLDRKVRTIPRIEGEWGVAYDLRGAERVEARHLLKSHVSSRILLEKILDAVKGIFPPNVLVRKGWVCFFSHSNVLTLKEMQKILGQFNVFLL